jgi:hypothetical protein
MVAAALDGARLHTLRRVRPIAVVFRSDRERATGAPPNHHELGGGDEGEDNRFEKQPNDAREQPACERARFTLGSMEVVAQPL